MEKIMTDVVEDRNAFELSNDDLGMVNAAGNSEYGGKVECTPQIGVAAGGCTFKGNDSAPASGGAIIHTDDAQMQPYPY